MGLRHPATEPNLSKDHDPLRAELFKQIFRGELQDASLTDIPSYVCEFYNALEGEEEWSRVQIRTLGGNMELAQAVASSQLGKSVENEEFWRTVADLCRTHSRLSAIRNMNPGVSPGLMGLW